MLFTGRPGTCLAKAISSTFIVSREKWKDPKPTVLPTGVKTSSSPARPPARSADIRRRLYWLEATPYREVVPRKAKFGRRRIGRPAMEEAMILATPLYRLL